MKPEEHVWNISLLVKRTPPMTVAEQNSMAAAIARAITVLASKAGGEASIVPSPQAKPDKGRRNTMNYEPPEGPKR